MSEANKERQDLQQTDASKELQGKAEVKNKEVPAVEKQENKTEEKPALDAKQQAETAGKDVQGVNPDNKAQ